MIFQPAILALLFAAGLNFVLPLAAAPFAVQILRHWDIASGSERQLRLERLTYLFSTLIAWVCTLQIVAALLFVFNADKMAALFVGAMCAVGTLNVNAYGFPALYLQLLLFFLAALWLVINSADHQARDYPLVRIKYALLLAVLPLLALNLWLQMRYFLGLKANVITSCCGSLFSTDAPTLASELSAWPPRAAMIAFYAVLSAATSLSLWHWRKRDNLSGYAVSLAALAALAVSIAGIVSFLSLYIYEHPNHHCPFCILKPDYVYQGYALYLPLFAATAASLGAGALRFFARKASLAAIVPRMSGQLAGFAAVNYALLMLIASIMIWRSRLILFG